MGGALATCRTRPCSTVRSNSIGANLTLESGSGGGKRFARDLFVDMYSLSMLAQIIEARESSRTMTLKRPLPRMFPDVSREMLAPCEAQITRRKVRAIEPLSFLLLRRGSVISSWFRLMVGTFPISVRIGERSIIRRRYGALLSVPRTRRAFGIHIPIWSIILIVRRVRHPGRLG